MKNNIYCRGQKHRSIRIVLEFLVNTINFKQKREDKTPQCKDQTDN